MSCIEENTPLAPLTYYKIGGPARFYAAPENEPELMEISKFVREKKPKIFILGAGSNVLFDDHGFSGLVIHTSEINNILSQAGTELTVGASVMVIRLLKHCMQAGLGGFERIAGIPGNMGGVFSMNAGTKTGEIKDLIEELTCFDFLSAEKRTLGRSDLKYTYREQHFLRPYEIILQGKLRGFPKDPKLVQQEIHELWDQRKKTQPVNKPSCGSVFKNPPGTQAWKLISDAGLRGHRIGNAQISEQHTNFIVNLGGAKAADVKTLIEEAKTQVLKKFGISLEEEVKIIPY
jgi:UDP-N-acetylmuramate dehydrogenase